MHSKTTLLLAVLVLLIVQSAFALISKTPGLSGQLTGPDAYMHLHRVLQLYNEGNWYDAFSLRTNAPFGEQLQWTRLLDAILLAGAWIGSAVTDFPRALWAWGMIIGPVTLLLLVPIWSWGTRAVLSPAGFILSLVMLTVVPVLNGVFLLGRPDHHGLLALAFLSMIAIFVRLATGQSQSRGALAAGVIAGTALWVSVEAQVAAAYFGAALALLWVWQGATYRRYLSFYLLGLFAALTIALIIERAPGLWLTPFYDRISIVHWFLTGIGLATWFAAIAIAPRMPIASERTCRIVLLAAVGLVTLVAVAIVFPKFFQGPLVDYRSPVFDAWWRANIETRPFWPITQLSLSKFVANLGSAIIALVYIGVAWKSASAERRTLFVILLLGFAIYLPLALNQLRWTSYAQELTLIPLVLALVGVWRWNGAVRIAGRALPLRSLVVALLATGPFIGFALVASSGNSTAQGVAARVYHGCDRIAISEHLNQIHSQGAPDDILFTYTFWGSELIWRTPYSVVGAPYGNAQSLADTQDLFGAADDTGAAEVVRRRGIDLILTCSEEVENSYYDADNSTFLGRLAEDPPAWLSPIDLPAHLAPTFRLYRVQDEKLPG
ncbi:MAG: hypothetical protein GKS02_04480 [Alphaproteobacteria bacterium]|nr:hypothetical protein [Alphaproteobacteria bacterium]